MRPAHLLLCCIPALLVSFGSVAAASDWTAMIYLDGDNNLEYYAGVEMNEINASDADIDCLVLKDDWGSGDSRLYHVRNGSTTSLDADWLGHEVNMGSGATLKSFVGWSLDNYPADNTLLVLWDHGGSFVGSCVDSTNGSDMLRLWETRTALENALPDGQTISVLGYADCLMAAVEVAYEMAPVAEMLVGSEKVGWAYGSQGIPWDFDDILEHLEGTDDAANVAGFIVEDAMELTSGMKYQSHTWSAIDLSCMEDLRVDMDALADELTAAFGEHHVRIILDRMATESYEGPYGNWFDRIIDLYHLCENILNDSSLPSSLRSAASDVMGRLNASVVAEDHWTAWNGNDEPCDHAHGLSINFPDIRSRMWSSYNTASGAYSWTADSGWDEFLGLYGSYLFIDDDSTGTADGSYEHPYAGIQDALDSAIAGDTLRVLDGVYDGDIAVKRSVRVVGNGSDVAALEGTGTGITVTASGVSIESLGISGFGIGLKISAGGLVLSDLTFSGLGRAIVLGSADDVDARYCDWDGAAESTIRALIKDSADSAGLGTVSYSPWYDNGTLVYADITPPLTVDNSDGGWHNGAYSFVLSPIDLGSGVNATYWRIDGGTWQDGTNVTVPAPTDHSGDGVRYVEYFSADTVGNKETIRNISVRVDTRPPELEVSYDAATDRLLFLPADSLDNSPSKSVSRSGTQWTITMTDHAGNVVKVKLCYGSSERNGWTVRKVSFTSIRYNGGSWTTFTCGERFAVRSRTTEGVVTGLEQLSVGDGWRVDAAYEATTDTTRFVVDDGGRTSSSEGGACAAATCTFNGSTRYVLP